MKSFALIAFIAVVSANYIPDEYLVVVRNDASPAEIHQHVKKYNMTKLSEWHIGTYFSGYAARMSQQVMNQVSEDELVKTVEPNYIAKATTCVTEDTGSWGLAAIGGNDVQGDKATLNKNGGKGVVAYILDTGIDCAHPLFGGRVDVDASRDYTGENDPCSDGNGHGTHVAGTVGADLYGVARSVTLVAVKVLGSSGSGSYQAIMDGINYVAGRSGKRVVNMSLTGSLSTALNDIAAAAVNAGVVMVAAAGNDGINAKNFSPGTAKGVVCVGSSTEDNHRSSFSNFGTDLDLFAPGSDITSTWPETVYPYTSTNVLSGTSMASPHVAGVAATYLADHTATPAEVTSTLNNKCDEERITYDCGVLQKLEGCDASPNRFLKEIC